MKKLIALGVLIGLVGGALVAAPAIAKKKKKRVERTVDVPYQCPCGPRPAGFWAAGGAIGGGFTATGGADLFVQVEIVDDGGQTVYAELGQDTDGDSLSETDIGSVCGKTGDALQVPAPGSNVNIFVMSGTCSDNRTPSIPTSGVVKLTFSNQP
jgi:hypothetical protein